jgi:hypothetical protein
MCLKNELKKNTYPFHRFLKLGIYNYKLYATIPSQQDAFLKKNFYQIPFNVFILHKKHLI